MGTYLLSLDQGTTSSRAILFDREQNILGVSQKEFTQCFPRDGWVEHNGYYYYTTPVATGALTWQLFTGCELAKGVTPPEGYSLQVTILADGIQSEPADAVIQAWGVDPSALTNG